VNAPNPYVPRHLYEALLAKDGAANPKDALFSASSAAAAATRSAAAATPPAAARGGGGGGDIARGGGGGGDAPRALIDDDEADVLARDVVQLVAAACVIPPPRAELRCVISRSETCAVQLVAAARVRRGAPAHPRARRWSATGGVCVCVRVRVWFPRDARFGDRSL